MFDEEMVKRNFPFEKKFGQKFLVQDKVGLRTFLVQDKVGLRKFSPYFKKLFSIKLRKFWSKTKLDLEHFHHISFLA